MKKANGNRPAPSMNLPPGTALFGAQLSTVIKPKKGVVVLTAHQVVNGPDGKPASRRLDDGKLVPLPDAPVIVEGQPMDEVADKLELIVFVQATRLKQSSIVSPDGTAQGVKVGVAVLARVSLDKFNLVADAAATGQPVPFEFIDLDEIEAL